MRILVRGGSALDAVEACAKIIEADTTDTSVGRGGKPNVLGEVELDASIMDGTTHRSGAVAAIKGYLHPISVARAVMERTPHVFIVGDGAERFAREIGAKTTQNLTASTRKLWVERLRSVGETPSSIRRRVKLLPVVRKTVLEERGTVNFLALDRRGDIASAVTTSGWAYKYPGRVGDHGKDLLRLGPVRDRDRLGGSEPPVIVVLLVQHGLPPRSDFHCEILDRDGVDAFEIVAAHARGHPVALRNAYVDDGGVEAGLLAQLARRGLGERLAVLDDARDHVPVIVHGTMEHQELLIAPNDDRGLATGPQSAATAA